MFGKGEADVAQYKLQASLFGTLCSVQVGGKKPPSFFFPILDEAHEVRPMTDEEIAARMRAFFGPTDHERQKQAETNGTR